MHQRRDDLGSTDLNAPKAGGKVKITIGQTKDEEHSRANEGED